MVRKNASPVWELELNGVRLFTKLSPTEAQCNVCVDPATNAPINIRLIDGNTSALISHLSNHEDYKKQYDKLKEQAADKTEAQKGSMDSFVTSGVPIDDRKVINFIAEHNLPFTIVEGQTSKALFNVALKSRVYYSQTALPNVYNAVQKRVNSDLKQCVALSFTSDIWTGPSSNFISLTAHGITKNWQRVKFMLNISEFNGSHTGELIAQKLQELIDSWSIENDKVQAFVCDEGRNIKVAFRDYLTFSGLNCGAHKINLVVRKSLLEDTRVEDLLKRCRKLVGHFKHSNLAYERLEAKQEQLKLPKHELIQDVTTRWNSTLLMIIRLLEQRKAIQRYLIGHEKRSIRELDLNEREWTLLGELEALLKPFEELTKIFSQDSATISLQFPLAKMIHNKLSSLSVSTDLIEVKSKVIDLLEEKFFYLEYDSVHGLAMFLDPRFKHSFVSNKDDFVSRVESLIADEIKQTETVDLEIEPMEFEPADTHSNSIYDMHKGFLDSSYEPQLPKNVTVAQELLKYKAESCIQLKCDPLVYWKSKENVYPLLSELAARFLSIPASSVASEQVFSAARDAFDYRRSNLSSKNAEMLIFLHATLPKINFQY